MMSRISISVAVVVLGLMVGCGVTAKTITARSASERSDVFTEVTGNEAALSGYGDVCITASIKTHLDGFYSGESKKSAHGKETYPFLVNVDGQAAVWKAEGKKHELPKYIDGRASRDPEAGEGIKYVLDKKIRLRAGLHKLFFGVPGDNYCREVMIIVKEGETQMLEFRPEYRHKLIPARVPTYMKGISHYAILVNGSPVAQ